MAGENDILADVQAAADELEGIVKPEIVETVETSPEPELQETAQQAADRARDEKGRFTEKPRETLKLKEKPETVAPPVVAKPVEGAAVAPIVPAKDAIAPPLEWKGAAKTKWDRLPADVQAEIRDKWQAIEGERAEVAPLKELIDVNRQFLVNEAGSVPEAFRQMVQFAQAANTVDGTIQLVQHLLQRKGIDIRALVGQPQGAPPQAPDVNSLIAQAVQQHLKPYQEAQDQREQQQINSQVEGFRADPKHPYFEDVRVHMGHLLQTGIATDMQDAYDKAVRLNPAISGQIEAAKEAERQKAEQTRKAKAAVRTTVNGAPLSGVNGSGQGDKKSSVLDDVRAAAEQLSGA